MGNNKEHIVYSAKGLSDLLFLTQNYSNISVVGGCTYLETIPDSFVSIRNIPELSFIDKHERFINIGPSVTLNEILSYGKNRLPLALYEAASTIADPFVRNLATIGGNILAQGKKLTLFAPLLAMDSVLKFRDQDGSQNILLSKFDGIPRSKVKDNGNIRSKVMPKQKILVNIKIPIEDWSVSIFRKLGSDNIYSETAASFCFLASTEKDILNDIRIAFAGVPVFRSRELENKLIGMRLPLTDELITSFTKTAGEMFDKTMQGVQYNPILRMQFINLVEYSIHQLS